MELDPDYTFVPLAPRHYMGIENKDTQASFRKWGLHNNISIQDYCFNEPFQPYNKYHIAEKFFKSKEVASSLLLKEGEIWTAKGILADSVEVKPVPCTVLNTSFFDRLADPENGVVSISGNIRQRYEMEIEGFVIYDNLRAMLLDRNDKHYNLFSDVERDEFIFRLFQILALGGSLCQYEDQLKPYVDVTRKMYRELVRVHKKEATSDLSIGTTVLQVVARDSQGEAFFPSRPEHRQNIGFLLVDGSGRQITTLLHQFGSFHW
ncbi:hypothetical protein QAD02_003907 [Eretmocerus hayati]|uniref:Uncharacterized protein n=1 Tax=Eretmocerus hayati TaxID=131215 RepID=A0ACC2NP90_9HYME|nr:hypothetical protein QAD02_003907 [Eretmocerus hayati]